MLILINILLICAFGFYLYLIVKAGRKRFQMQDERMQILENEFLSLYKKWKMKND